MAEKQPRLYTYDMLFEKVKEVIRSLPHGELCNALDAPAGGGALTRFLNEEMKLKTAAVEIDSQKWEYAAVPLTVADIGRRLPFDDGAFDLTICMEGLKHVTDASAAIREIARVTRPGGWLIFTFSNDLAMQCRLRYLLTGFVDADRNMLQSAGTDDDQRLMYVRSSVALPLFWYFMEQNNLELVRTESSRLRMGSALLAALLYPLAWWNTTRATRLSPVLSRELMSFKWLAGRHNLLLCRKMAAC